MNNLILTLIFFLALSTTVLFFGKLLTWIAYKINPSNSHREITNKNIDMKDELEQVDQNNPVLKGSTSLKYASNQRKRHTSRNKKQKNRYNNREMINIPLLDIPQQYDTIEEKLQWLEEESLKEQQRDRMEQTYSFQLDKTISYWKRKKLEGN